MTFPNNVWEHAESALEICRNGNESTFWQNIGNSFSRYQYNTRFTYTSNHKLHIYIKPIYIKPQSSHIHQTTSFTYTSNPYTSNHIHKLHIYFKPQASQKEEKKTSDLWVRNGRNEVGGASTYIYMKQSRSNGKYRWINGRNEVGRRRKPSRSSLRRVWSE